MTRGEEEARRELVLRGRGMARKFIEMECLSSLRNILQG